MSFSDWSNEKKKKQSQGQTAETQTARQQTSGVTAGSADTFTQWSNRKKNGTTITGYNDKEAISGWNAYQAAKNAREQQEEDKTWFEKLAGYLGGVSDTTMPTAEMSRVTESYREDTTYREPRKDWTLQQMKEFGFLYQRNPQEAWEYAEQLNMGLPAKTKDYTYMQNEKFIKPQYHEYRGRMVQDKATNYMPNEYWDFSKSGKENAEAYLQMCARNNKRPKFYKLLQNNGDGSYSLKADSSTDGYWKLLIDFKMYDNDGNGSPQAPVRPEFNMEESARMMREYKGGHSSFPVAQGIVDAFVQEYKQEHPGRQFSDRKQANRTGENAPTFYSYMGLVVDGMKQEKFGAASVVNMLRGKGVKTEEIKWSGIEQWLEGKKSVTKTELQEFIAGSMLQIEEDLLTDAEIPYTQEQLDIISGYEKERDIIAEELKEEWKRIVGEDIPITHFGAGLESVVVQHLLEVNAAKRGNTAEGKAYKAARAAMQKVIENGDHFFGFDNGRQALREILRNPSDFLRAYELTPDEEEAIHNVIKTKEAFSKVDGIPLQDQQFLKEIAERADAISRKIGRVKSDHYAEAAKHKTKYGSYILSGGSNYRELLFRLPGATYHNNSMNIHWDRSGVLAHARTIACLVVGFIIKKWIKDVDNRLIPTIVALFGLGLSVASNWGSLTIALAVGGALSGLASTGLHQMFAQWIDNGGK